MAKTATILITVSDGVLADSLRFALELEGLAVTLCDEYSLPRRIEGEGASCLVLDQEVFPRVENHLRSFAGRAPIILMIGRKTDCLLERAEQAGVTMVIETPLMGAALLDAITSSLKASRRAAHRFS